MSQAQILKSIIERFSEADIPKEPVMIRFVEIIIEEIYISLKEINP